MRKHNKFTTGTKFKMDHVERDGAVHIKSTRTYTILKEYPHFFLTEYEVNGSKIRVCYTKQEIESSMKKH